MEKKKALELRQVSVHYANVLALDRVSISLEQASLTGLIGLNGSGKSTLFKASMGVQPLSSGSIQILGQQPAQARLRGLLSYMPQNEAVDWNFPISVHEVVAMGRYRATGITRRLGRADRQMVAQALERVQLTGLAQRQIGQLSGGQKKRVFMARALAQQAQIFLLDEPFAGVDQASEAMLIQVLKELSQQGKTVLVSTHHVQNLNSYANQVILLRQRVLMQGPVSQVLQPENLVKAFGMEVES
ncbi:MAG: metal ABC transporter ATP-binding protein [Rothia sp. (in: high G+C Gram-positive bacteria)]|nr:metal ABC transporter ATP-binding protein [Rothia sp. (in: high G+C Gram-positive bacteria)]